MYSTQLRAIKQTLRVSPLSPNFPASSVFCAGRCVSPLFSRALFKRHFSLRIGHLAPVPTCSLAATVLHVQPDRKLLCCCQRWADLTLLRCGPHAVKSRKCTRKHPEEEECCVLVFRFSKLSLLGLVKPERHAILPPTQTVEKARLFC